MDDKERIEELKKKLTEIAEKEGMEIVFVENEEPAEPVLPSNIDDFPVYQMTPVFPKALTGQEKRRERRAKERELRKKKI